MSYEDQDSSSEDELAKYAAFLGMTLPEDEEFLYIAQEGLSAPTPEPWEAYTADGDCYYFNADTGESIWEHPCDAYYRELFETEKNRRDTQEPQSNMEQDFAEQKRMLRDQCEQELDMQVEKLNQVMDNDLEQYRQVLETEFLNETERINREVKHLETTEQVKSQGNFENEEKKTVELGQFKEESALVSRQIEEQKEYLKELKRELQKATNKRNKQEQHRQEIEREFLRKAEEFRIQDIPQIYQGISEYEFNKTLKEMIEEYEQGNRGKTHVPDNKVHLLRKEIQLTKEKIEQISIDIGNKRKFLKYQQSKTDRIPNTQEAKLDAILNCQKEVISRIQKLEEGIMQIKSTRDSLRSQDECDFSEWRHQQYKLSMQDFYKTQARSRQNYWQSRRGSASFIF